MTDPNGFDGVPANGTDSSRADYLPTVVGPAGLSDHPEDVELYMDPVDITSVLVLTGTQVRLGFDDGTERDLDLKPLMVGPVFDEVFNTGTFDQVSVSAEEGTVVWPNGANLDAATLRHQPA